MSFLLFINALSVLFDLLFDEVVSILYDESDLKLDQDVLLEIFVILYDVSDLSLNQKDLELDIFSILNDE